MVPLHLLHLLAILHQRGGTIMTAANLPSGIHELFADSEDETRIAADLNRILGEIRTDAANIQIGIKRPETEDMIPVTPQQFRMLAFLLGEIARGHAISIIPMEAELTTNEAAHQLKVSRPFLIGLLEKGEIPYRMVGTHRRVRFRDLEAYKERTAQKRLEALEALSTLDQEYGLE
jgi:excisionase family DNA binding protein